MQKRPSKVKRSMKEINDALDALHLEPPETRKINRNRRLGQGATHVLFNHADDLVGLKDKAEFLMSEKMQFEEPPEEYKEGSYRPQCFPTSQRYYTVPHERYKTSDGCPAYAPLDGEGTGCCTIPMNDNGDKFIRYLAGSVNRVEDLALGRRVLSPDLLEWLERYDESAFNFYGPIRIDKNVPYVNVLLHFLLITKPMFDVFLIRGYYDNNGRHIYNLAERSWVLDANDTELLRLSKSPGINGTLIYRPLSTTPIYTPIPLKSSKYVIDVGARDFVDVTNIGDFFSSDECGFRGEKDIVIYGQGVVLKTSSLYEVVRSVIQAMPDHNCVFQMGIDTDERAYEMGSLVSIEETHTRLFRIRKIFAYGVDLNNMELMSQFFMPLRVDLPTRHREPDYMASGGAVGNYSGTLYPDIGDFFDPMAPLHPRHNYSLRFDVTYDDERDEPCLRITKTMLTNKWRWVTSTYSNSTRVYRRVVVS